MSGGQVSVSGLSLSSTSQFTDLQVYSVLHEVASRVSNDNVQSDLHAALAQGAPDGRLPVTVESYQEGSADSYTFTCESLQVSIPLNTYKPPITDVVDSSICIFIGYWSYVISDEKVRTSVKNAAQGGLQIVAQHLAQNAVLQP